MAASRHTRRAQVQKAALCCVWLCLLSAGCAAADGAAGAGDVGAGDVGARDGAAGDVAAGDGGAGDGGATDVEDGDAWLGDRSRSAAPDSQAADGPAGADDVDDAGAATVDGGPAADGGDDLAADGAGDGSMDSQTIDAPIADAPNADATPTPDAGDAGPLLIGGANFNGTGFVAFSAAPTAILPGWQGLQHMWVSFRAPASLAKAGMVSVSVTLQVAGQPNALLPGATKAKVPLTADPNLPGWFGYDGVAAVVLCPCEAKGKKVRVTVQLALPSGDVQGQAETVATWAGPCVSKPSAQCGG